MGVRVVGVVVLVWVEVGDGEVEEGDTATT